MNMLENRDVMDLSKLKKESFMEYVGKNCGALSLMIAVITPIVSIYLTLMVYSYYHGYYSYFKISDIWLDLNNKSNIYNLVFIVFVSLAIMALNVIPIILVKSKKIKNLIISIGIGLLIILILIILLSWPNGKLDMNVLLQSFSIWFVLYGVGLTDSICSFCGNRRNNKKSDTLKGKTKRNTAITIGIIVIVGCLIADVIICYFTGISVANSEKEFKIIEYNDGYAAILNESNDNFVISEVDWDKDTNQLTIYADEQTVIDNKNVIYQIIEFVDVRVNK